MDGNAEQIAQRARALHFDDIRFASAQGTLRGAAGNAADLQTLLPGATCLIVLFAAYRPAGAAPPGRMPLSPYYTVSHAAYHGARALAAYLERLGASAAHVPQLPARAAALRTGGWIGDNGFYYHPRLGSLVCIQTVLTNACPPLGYDAGDGACRHCRWCVRACPFGAVGNIQRCLRYHINGLVPEPLRGGVYQLFGCELCQAACPLNSGETAVPHSFEIDALLDGREADGIRALVGPNLARPGRLQSQAVLYAANTGQQRLAAGLAHLAANANEPVRTHARWALGRLQSGVSV